MRLFLLKLQYIYISAIVKIIDYIKTGKVFFILGEQVKTKIIYKLIFSVLDFLELYFDIYHYDFQGSLEATVRKRREYVIYYYGDVYLNYANSRRSRKLVKDNTEEEWLESEFKYLNEFMEIQEEKTKNW